MTMKDEISFGAFLRSKRLCRNISLRYLVELLDLSPVHLSNIENDRRPAPKGEVLKKIIEVLQLNKQEQIDLYELAAKSKDIPSVPNDLPEYISTNELARVALRTAKDVDATDKEWRDFIERLKKRSKQEE